MVFLPSFEYLDMVSKSVENMLKDRGDLKIIRQTSGMTELEKNAYLSHFDSAYEGLLVGFAVIKHVADDGVSAFLDGADKHGIEIVASE